MLIEILGMILKGFQTGVSKWVNKNNFNVSRLYTQKAIFDVFAYIETYPVEAYQPCNVTPLGAMIFVASYVTRSSHNFVIWDPVIFVTGATRLFDS